jgi:negative regulator of sigma E activity
VVPYRRPSAALLAGGLAATLALAGALTGDACAARRVASDPEAVRLLEAATRAANRVPYEGTQFLTTWSGKGSTTSLVRVAHTPGAGTYFDADEPVQRGTAPSSSRTVAGATTGRTYQADSSAGRGALIGFTTEMLALLTRNYSLVRAADASVCGRRARVIEARRGDGTAAGRFWVDSETGLMLHRELLDAGGRSVAATGFRELRIARPARDTRVSLRGGRSVGESTVPVITAAPWDDRLEPGELGALRRSGWRIPDALPGHFRLYDARREADTVHLSYTDGLAAVSVFVQRGGAVDRTRLNGWQRTGDDGKTVFRRDSLQHWAVWSGDGYVYTVLTDAPQGTADTVIDALPEGAGPHFWGRMGRGARRLGSWVNPFD